MTKRTPLHNDSDVLWEAGLEAIFRIHCRGKPLAEDVHLAELAAETEGLVGAEIENVCARAAYLAIERCARESGVPVPDLGPAQVAELRIREQDFRAALEQVRAERLSTTPG
ncbi:MAG: hypothetical protein HY690_18460 [Chloroflexi bacterium]|nr:hypothetical protein [Chloroflexota bacterium]